MNVRTFYYILLLLPSVVLAQRQMVVVNVESKVPVRDVKISTDGGQELRTSWDGLFALPDSFRRLDFHHPDFERRYVLSSELKGDTIFLIPNVNALREVVIYGERRFDKRMAQMLKPSPQQQERDKLPQVIPAGPNVLAIAAWLYENLYGKKREKRLARKKALEKVRKQEAELQERWDSLEKEVIGFQSRLFSALPAPVPLYFERVALKLYCSDMPISLEYWLASRVRTSIG